MDTRKLSLILILGGVAVIALSIVWFFAVYAEAMDTMSQFGGNDMAGKIMSCLYSSDAVCQGGGFMSDAPSYTPVIFWIGLIGLIAGVVMRFVLKAPAVGTASSGMASGTAGFAAEPAPAGDGPLLGFISPGRYTKTVYILVLIGAICVLLVPPLAIIGVAGLVLALLGLLTFKPRLTALDATHLLAICIVFVASSLLLLLTAGNFLFLVVGLVQLALYYIGFNSFRHGRTIGAANFKEEAQFALKPLSRTSRPDGSQ